MAIHINHSEDPFAVPLENLRNGGVVVVCDDADSWNEFIGKVCTTYHTWLNANTDTFDPVMVDAVLDLNKKDNDGKFTHDALKFDPLMVRGLVTSFLISAPIDTTRVRTMLPEFDELMDGAETTMEMRDKLGDAYVSMLDWHELQADGEPTTQPTAVEIADRFKITINAAEIILAQTNLEYTEGLHSAFTMNGEPLQTD